MAKATKKGGDKGIGPLLRDLAVATKRKEALIAISDRLVPFDRVNDASPAGLSLLLEAATDRKLPKREDVLEVALHVVEGDQPRALLARGMDLDVPELANRYAKGAGALVRRALEDGVDTVLRLLDDSDAAVRLGGARLASLCSGRAEAVVPRLVERASEERDARVRACLALALTYLAKNRREVGPTLRKMTESPTVLDRVAARIGESVVAEAVSPALRDELADGLIAAADRWPDTTIAPWRLGFIDDHMLALLGDGVLGDAGREVATRAVLAAGKRLHDAARASHWTHHVLRWNFRPGAKGHRTLYESPLRAEDLSPLQREVVAGLSEFENQQTGNEYALYGLPPDARSRRRLVGLARPSVLERPVSNPRITKGETWPLFRVIAAATKGDRPIRKTLAAELSALSVRERLDLWTELSAQAYGLGANEDARDVLLDEAKNAPREVVEPWADDWLKDLTTCPDRDALERAGWAIVRAVLDKSAKKDVVPEKLDPLLTLFGPIEQLREIYARVPPTRVLSIVERSLAQSSMPRSDALARVRDVVVPIVPQAKRLLVTK